MNINALAIAALMAAMPLTMNAGGFSIKGRIAGLPDSVKVTLTDVEDPNGKKVTIAETISKGEAFEVNGSVDSPRMCNLILSKYNAKHDRYMTQLSVPVMIENSEYNIGTELSLDSLLKISEPDYNVTVTGGTAQEQLNSYRSHVKDTYLRSRQASYMRASKYFDTNDNRDTMIKYEALAKEAEANFAAVRAGFIKAHPEYHISAYLTQKELENPFAYTADEINAMADAAKVCPDTARVSTVDRRRNFALKYALGMKYPDFAITSPENAASQASQHIVPGKYNFIDFWASWCGPCRAAIPHVKELSEKYGDKLNIISISLDEDEADWRKAMDEEKMTWKQLYAKGDQMGEVAKAYFITTIPRLILINNKGEVVCSTNKPDEVTEFLKNNLGE
ncbi:MAG: AhpC/TSA family protein [Bacteroides sp.]|nr:AhpC/TSA family protein [Bacteroides sp.]